MSCYVRTYYSQSLVGHYVFVLFKYFLYDREHFYHCQIVGNMFIIGRNVSLVPLKLPICVRTKN